MSIEKAELKAAVAHEIGCGIDDALEAAKATMLRFEGEKTAFVEGAKAVGNLLAHLQADLKANQITLEQAQVAQRYVERALHLLQNLRIQAEGCILRAQGKIQGLDEVIKITKKLRDMEQKKAEAIKAGPSPVEDNGRSKRGVGEHPGPSIRRRREKKAKDVAKLDSEVLVETAPAVPQDETPQADATESGGQAPTQAPPADQTGE